MRRRLWRWLRPMRILLERMLTDLEELTAPEARGGSGGGERASHWNGRGGDFGDSAASEADGASDQPESRRLTENRGG